MQGQEITGWTSLFYYWQLKVDSSVVVPGCSLSSSPSLCFHFFWVGVRFHSHSSTKKDFKVLEVSLGVRRRLLQNFCSKLPKSLRLNSSPSIQVHPFKVINIHSPIQVHPFKYINSSSTIINLLSI